MSWSSCGMCLRCRGVSVSFPSNGARVTALRQLNFDVGRNEFLAIVGPSGCGKTTLLRTLGGMLKPDEGTVERMEDLNGGAGRTLLVRQEDSLFPWMTLLENVTFGLEIQGVERRERERRAVSLLGRFGLGGRENDYPHQLSLGMKQRVAVAACFASNPAILLMDEPFAALDYQTRLGLQQELIELWEQDQKSVVFVTHDVEEAILLSDRILVLSRQPGTVRSEIPVPFPRPRTSAVTLQPEFLSLKRRICSELGVVPASQAVGA